jgi:hypothetical protein
MATEDVQSVTVASGGSHDAMGKKLLELWSRLNERLSPEAKSRLEDMLKQYKELSDSEKKDFEGNLKQQLHDHVAYAARNRFLSEIMDSTLLVVCAATVFLLFGMNPVFTYQSDLMFNADPGLSDFLRCILYRVFQSYCAVKYHVPRCGSSYSRCWKCPPRA